MNQHWNLTVGDAFEFVRNGKSIKQDRDAGGLPITRIETIADGQIDIERVGYAGVELAGNEQWLLREGDILFSHINSVQHVGKCAIYEGTPAQMIHGMNLLALRPSKNLHPRYALYALRQPAFRVQLLQFVNKAVNQASVSTTNLKSIPFSLPPLDEQRRIAAILDKADALRQKRKRAIALLDSLTQSIFLEMFGDPKKGLSRWPLVPFEAACRDETSMSEKLEKANFESGGSYPVIDQGQSFIGGWTSKEIVCRSTLPVVVFGDHTRIVKYVDRSFVIGADGAKVLKPSPSFDALYFSWLLRLMPIADLGYSRHMREVKRMSFWLPPTELQQQFSNRALGVMQQSEAQKRLLTQAEALFASLQHRAFSGHL